MVKSYSQKLRVLYVMQLSGGNIGAAERLRHTGGPQKYL